MTTASGQARRRAWRWFFPTSFFTPKGLAIRAMVLVLVYLVLHAVGLREYVTVFSGTSPTGKLELLPAVFGASYAIAYLGAVVIAPILTLAAALFALAAALVRALEGS